MDSKDNKAINADSLKENEGNTPEMAEKKPKRGKPDFFAPSSLNGGIDDFIKTMKTPREKVDIPEIRFGDEPVELPDDDDKILDEVEEGTLSHFDYDEDHASTAEFMWMGLDFAISTVAGIYSGEDPEKYARFSGNKKPTEYQISVGAAVVKKYQAKMSLEWMLATLVMMAFGPTMNTAIKDRKANKRKEALEEERLRAEAMARNFGKL